MSKKEMKNRKKAVVFLVSLFVYAFLLLFIFYENKEVAELSFVESPKASYQEDLVAMVDSFEHIDAMEIEEIEETVDKVSAEDKEAEVKGLGDFIERLRRFFVGSCDDPAYEIFEPQLFCGWGEGVDAEDVRIAQIWAPDVLFVGAEAPFDNLVQINNPRGSTAFRNASEIINPDFDYYISMPPNHPSAPLLDSVPLPDDDRFEPYDMHYEAAGSLNEIPFDVHPEEKSLCPEVVNAGEFNVKGSNNLQKELTDSYTPPGLMELGDREISVDLCREDRVIKLDEDESFLLCNEGFLDVIRCGARFSLRNNCDGIGDLVIDAPLGSGEICNEDDCSIRYSEAARILSSPPTWTKDMYPSISREEKENDYIVDDPVIVTTPCYVRVDCQVCPTRCIWDISMWQHIFKLEKMYTYPGYENAMDEDSYWEAVEDELKYRGRFGIIGY